MKIYLVIGIVVLVLLAGCTHNLTKLDDKGVYARTSTNQDAFMNPDGQMRASFSGIGPTQLMQDANGNWTNMPGPVAVLSVPMPSGGVGYIISPKDTKIAKMSYTPKPADGQPAVVIEGLEANLSEPMSQQVAALTVALPILQEMTKAEALATIEKWRIAGTMVPTIADLLKSLITAVWPVAAVVP